MFHRIILSTNLNCLLGHEIKPENLGLVTTKGDNPMQPFMVVFLKNINSGKPRQVRDIYTKRSIKSPALTMSSFINRGKYFYIIYKINDIPNNNCFKILTVVKKCEPAIFILYTLILNI